jgi:hypothetical protein
VLLAGLFYALLSFTALQLPLILSIIIYRNPKFSNFNCTILNIRPCVFSATYKHSIGGLVVRRVTTSEFPQLYVFYVFYA